MTESTASSIEYDLHSTEEVSALSEQLYCFQLTFSFNQLALRVSIGRL